MEDKQWNVINTQDFFDCQIMNYKCFNSEIFHIYKISLIEKNVWACLEIKIYVTYYDDASYMKKNIVFQNLIYYLWISFALF